MTLKIARWLLGLGLFLFCLDRLLKWQAAHAWGQSQLLNPWFGWHPFNNLGVAFGLPLPNWLAAGLAIPIMIYIGYRVSVILSRLTPHAPRPIFHLAGLIAIFSGALSNLIDRVLYGYTIDYLLIFTGVFNLGDSLIIAGLVAYFYSQKSGRAKADSGSISSISA